MIYCVTLNPALDYIIELEEQLTSGHNNRIINKYIDVGGKGTHVSIALSLLGEENVCTGISGEKDYDLLSNKLNEFGVQAQFIKVADNSVRNNYIITSNTKQSSYLLTEMGITLSENLIDELFDSYLLEASHEDIIIIAGNPSNDTSIEVFKYFFEKAINTGSKIAIDLHGKYLELALNYSVYFAKPNQHEFSELVGEEIETLEDIKSSLLYMELKNIKHLCISLGKRGSVLVNKNEIYQFDGLQVNTKNDTGSGDAYFAGIIYSLVNGLDMIDAGKIATALGAAKAEEKISSGFNIKRFNNLKEKVKYRKV